MNTLVETPQFDLLHDPAYACLYATWRGPHSLPRTQANYELILGGVQATHSQKLLNDTLLDHDGWQELTNWIAQDCFPHLAKQGVLTVAWVLPRNGKALYAARKVLDKLTEPLVETFGDAEAAYTWLQQWPMSGKRDFPLTIL
jgi:hypothetical protein